MSSSPLSSRYAPCLCVPLSLSPIRSLSLSLSTGSLSPIRFISLCMAGSLSSYTYLTPYMYVYISLCVSVYVTLYVYVCISLCVSVCMCVSLCVCVSVCLYINTHTQDNAGRAFEFMVEDIDKDRASKGLPSVEEAWTGGWVMIGDTR